MRAPLLLLSLLPLLSLLCHGTATTAADAYDVIVVGSGPGGLVAAEFLSRDPAVRVLVLEAGAPSLAASGGADGPRYAAAAGLTQFDIPGEFDNTIYNPVNEQYRVDWIAGPSMWLGKLVGGCSSLNAALYLRAPERYVTSAHWPFPAARVAALTLENEQLHGVTDTPSTDGRRYTQEAYAVVSAALDALGYEEQTTRPLHEVAGTSQVYGHAPFAIQGGLRDAPAKTCWSKLKTRANVQLETAALVSSIRQDKGKATGVVYRDGVEAALTARGAVLMAAGALSTPKVLIQSGIGPKSQLELLLSMNKDFPGVSASRDQWDTNENVGKSVFDTNVVFASFSHKKMKSFQYKNKPQDAIDQFMNQNRSGPWASPGPVLLAYESYEVNGRTYDFQTTVLTAGFGDFYQNKDAFTTSLYVNNPEARDASGFKADGKWYAFTADSAYFGTRNDLEAMQSYTKRVIGALTKSGAKFLSAASGQSVADWVAANKGDITHHFGGSCYASSDANDAKRCADEQLRVVGTSNVFIGDASAMRDGTVNPYGFVMYIGREAGEQVKAFIGSANSTSNSSSVTSTTSSIPSASSPPGTGSRTSGAGMETHARAHLALTWSAVVSVAVVYRLF